MYLRLALTIVILFQVLYLRLALTIVILFQVLPTISNQADPRLDSVLLARDRPVNERCVITLTSSDLYVNTISMNVIQLMRQYDINERHSVNPIVSWEGFLIYLSISFPVIKHGVAYTHNHRRYNARLNTTHPFSHACTHVLIHAFAFYKCTKLYILPSIDSNIHLQMQIQALVRAH